MKLKNMVLEKMVNHYFNYSYLPDLKSLELNKIDLWGYRKVL